MYEFKYDDLSDFITFIGSETKEKGKEIEFKHCPYCDGGENGDKWTFSVNSETGRFNCMREKCGAKGAFVTLARDFNFDLRQETDYREFDNSFQNSPKAWGATAESKEILRKRGIPYEITEKFCVTTYAGKDDILVFPFFDSKRHLTTIKYRNSKFVKGKTEGSKEWYEANTRPILYGMWLCGTSGTLVVTEGQIDALSLSAAGIENAVSVPGGAKNFKWVDNCREFVEQFDEIVIFGDCEKGKITLVDGFCEAFPEKKIRVVQVADYLKCKDANEILQSFESNGDYEESFEILRQCVERAKNARQLPIKQLSDIEWHYSDDDPVIRTGFRQLDNTIRGLSYGQLCILTGWSGDGKSNFASQLLVNIANQGIKCLVYSGELSNKLVKEQIAFITAGSARINQIIKADGTECRRFRDEDVTRDALTEWMRNRLYIWEDKPITTDSTDANETAHFVITLENTIKALCVKFIILDNLMTLLSVSEDKDVYQAQTNVIKKLKAIAQQLDCIIMLVAHPRKSPTASRELTQDSISGSKDIVNLADMVLAYTRHNDEEKKDYARRLNILKNRRRGILLEGKSGVYLCYDSKSNRICETKQDVDFDYLQGYAPPVTPEIDF